MNKVIDKGFRSCRFVSTIVKHPVFDNLKAKPALFEGGAATDADLHSSTRAR